MFQDLSNKKNGYTLMEVIIAMFIFGIVAVGLSLPFQESFNLTSRSENVLRASALAKAYLKEVDILWQNPLSFDNEQLPIIDDKYTDTSTYQVSVLMEDIEVNADGTDAVRRVSVSYANSSNVTLVEYFMDFNRPGMI